MNRSHSLLDNLGQIFSFGRMLPSESELTRDMHTSLHFMNTLDLEDPMPLSQETLTFRKKHQPLLYNKSYSLLKSQQDVIFP